MNDSTLECLLLRKIHCFTASLDLDSIDLLTGDRLISTLTEEEEEMLHHLTRWHQGLQVATCKQ
jgi:hypothetical protein